MTGEALQSFQEEMQNIRIIIIDEISMVGCKMLGRVDQRLRQAYPRNVILGGYIVLFFGDLNQLQPVGDIPLYGTPKPSNVLAIQGHIVYRHINKTFILSRIMRQVGDDQKQFRECLTRVARGEITEADYQLLATRFTVNNQNMVIQSRDVLRLISTNAEIEDFNLEKLRNLNKPVVRIQAVHNDPRAALVACDEARGLVPLLYLCEGAKVILRQNLFTSAGLCNGTIGEVISIIYEPCHDVSFNNQFPRCIMVKFENYSGPKYYGTNILPIRPETVAFKKGSNTFTRKQFPLQLAYAISIHRSQGLTLDQAVVSIGEREFALGMTYVALSRVRTLNGLFLDPAFPFDRLKKVNDKKGLIEKRRELARLESLQ